MEEQLLRLSSYALFPKSSTIYAIRLADAGFTYSGVEDEVQCHACGMQYKDWKHGDSPMDIHFQRSPNCPFLEQKCESSTTKSHKNENHLTEKFDHSKSYEVQYKHSDDHGVSQILFESLTNSDQCSKAQDTMSELGIFECQSNDNEATGMTYQCVDMLGISYGRPRHPEYAILTVRISSYRKWPSFLTQCPQEMAKAGFFYTGQEDLVRCFQCGGGLTNWENDDDPFVEHAQWFPDCIFLRQCKGDQFIQHVQELVKKRQTIDTQNFSSLENEDYRFSESETGNEASSLMSAPSVRSVLEMGYSESKVKSAIEYLRSKNGKQTFSAIDIMGVLFEFEENSQIVTSPIEISEWENGNDPEVIFSNLKEEEKWDSHVNDIEEIKSLQEENSALKEKTVCKICMDDNVSIVFLPCGHLATCSQCAPALKHCPICRTFIKGTVKTFLV